MAISDSGIWIDDESGEVVFSPPSKGTQLVAKGGNITSLVRARLEREGFTGDLPDDDEPAGDSAASTDASGETATVTTDDVKPKSAPRKRK